MKITAAVLTDSGDEFYFASLDGESFREINTKVDATNVSEARAVLESKSPGFTPMTIARRFLSHRGTLFTTVEG